MRQLWISGERMDSIHLLRLKFESAQGPEERKALCSQLLRQYHSGALGSWLRMQPELYAARSERRRLQTEELRRLLEQLESRPEMVDTELLSILCQIPAEAFDLQAQASLEVEAERKREQLRQMPYWEQLRHVAEWEYVVLDDRQLSQALRRRRENSKSAHTINLYLCNTGDIFWLDLGKEDQNIRFIGCGGPAVRMDPRKPLAKLDAEAQGLYFKDLDLRCPPTAELKGWEKRSENFRLIRYGGEQDE